ncbi:hypothetical protein AGOR_G00047100 [Albula goreensis]|uniref:Uncharacterized protein n=1 Tax=Albula goreensis TaxID=1534307 RepID=A0A8T3E0S0_9TELE|nr:hypothetical protein AGOR_G00047100 [Albula goreensis]
MLLWCQSEVGAQTGGSTHLLTCDLPLIMHLLTCDRLFLTFLSLTCVSASDRSAPLGESSLHMELQGGAQGARGEQGVQSGNLTQAERPMLVPQEHWDWTTLGTIPQGERPEQNLQG